MSIFSSNILEQRISRMLKRHHHHLARVEIFDLQSELVANFYVYLKKKFNISVLVEPHGIRHLYFKKRRTARTDITR